MTRGRPPGRPGASTEADAAASVLELSVRIVRSDRSIPFESKVNIPVGDGRDHEPAMRGWLAMIEAGLKLQGELRGPIEVSVDA